ncbi:ERCC4-related helicase [Lysinibacillus composti]|uniref:Helicase SNF2 n=1 Tax=Lysinibacillus composti TaxID=720633 RepID=A0A3N9UKY9_9BACI|nr:helicase-related protein [Lysinibacillus composti]MBM7610142.1 ERCC4-related helicase [Lysinibacillus composti]RQW73212.1 helicase SNF2 [Lysinibacillus composti]
MPEIPEIIDNRTSLLKDTINKLIKYADKVDIAAGYFYLNGFNLVKENINENCSINIVIGNETNAMTASEISSGYDLKKNLILRSMEKDISYLDDNQKQEIYELSELIRDGKVNFKIFVKDKFHSKAYIFDVSYNNGDIKEQYAIVGSSNFTKSGLGDHDATKMNTELNAVLRQPSAIKEVKNWFNGIWNEAEDFNEQLLNIIDNNIQVEKLEFSPFDILLKTLFEYLKDDPTFEEIQSLNLDDLTEFQAFAVRKAIQILEKYNGVIIADSVGLGKTYVAKGLLRYFSLHEMTTLIICPASLKTMWEHQANELNISIELLTQEAIGKDGIPFDKVQNVENIIIDEAHNFRNDNANRYKELIQVTMDKKVVQLTATPVNNSIYDLYNILTLFLKDDDFKNKFGIAKLKDIFNNYEEKKDQVSNILNEVMIRRSRTFIRRKYGNKEKTLYVNGKEIRFPSRHLKKISYSISDLYGENIFTEIANTIEYLNLPIISEDSISKKHQFNNNALVKTMLLKRFESSVEAFRNSIMKQIRYCNLLLSAISEGFLVTKKDVMDDLDSDSFDILDNVTKINLSDYQGNIEDLLLKIEADKENLNKIIEMIADIDHESDVKLQTLINHIKLEYRKNKKQKLLIFTQFKDTARYIYKHLLDNNFGIVSEIDSKNNQNNKKEKVVAQFAPIANPELFDPEKPEINILVSTDILSEGQNLQDCNTIINYDLTWNPVRIIQREGRIDRITTEHNNIYIYNFIPDDKLDSILKLTKRLSEKIKYINETIGNESRIISDDEILIDKVFNEKDHDQILRINSEDQSLLDELELDREEIVPSDEYIYEDYKELIFNNDENKKLVSNFPDGIFSIKKSELYKGIFMYFKVSNESYWLFYDINLKEMKTSKAEIYKIISSGNYLSNKPIKRETDYNVNLLLEIGKKYVADQVNDIAQIQVTSSEIDKVQKDIAERLEKIFSKTKFRTRITREQRKIRKKLKNPLHKGTISKLKTIEISLLSDEELINKLDEILEYIDIEENVTDLNKNSEVRLICYELFI